MTACNRNIPVGVSDFTKIRENGYYYIDKTELISELLKSTATEVTLITRPRRFGKTMAMSMLADFFDIRKDSRELFAGLEIMNETELCKEWMNQWPVMFVSFKDVSGTTFENAFGMLKFTISQFCMEHSYLETSEKTGSDYQNIFSRLKDQTASLTDIQSSLLVIMKMMQAHYGRPILLLLDEYDVPVAKASSNGYYEKMLEVIRAMMSTALKDNSSLRFAIVTGCLKITKESIFTGVNNFVADTITSKRLNEYFGFTQSDVDRLLRDTGLEAHSDSIKAWYDGYRFGDIDVYCPWDVMNYVHDLQFDPSKKPASYWKNTSDNAIIRSFIDYAGASITRKLEILLSGGYIVQRIEEDLTYDYLHSSEENLWSVLYLTGYLTRAQEKETSAVERDGEMALVIPNAEIREIFETTVIRWFEDSARTWDRKKLFDAVWNGDGEMAAGEMNRLLRRTISYYDYREDFYHAFLAAIFAGAGYLVESNREHGEGWSDVVVYDSVEGRVAVFEVKYSKTEDQLSADCDAALQQIDERKYAEEFEDSYDQIFSYGIAFYKKRCLIRRHPD